VIQELEDLDAQLPWQPIHFSSSSHDNSETTAPLSSRAHRGALPATASPLPCECDASTFPDPELKPEAMDDGWKGWMERKREDAGRRRKGSLAAPPPR